MAQGRKTAWLIVVLAPLLGASLGALAQSFSMDAHIFAAGSSLRSAGGCYRLQATIAEPVAGYSSGPDYALRSGFVANAPVIVGDAIFFNGFEECPP